ncbi:autotransporter domain-containing protein [Rhodoligotrophos defluvii]|uniref:autotransporter family protein n=1 Tax=Rhodoligotrophos defluvii TaxID=2561934 RepID=UPI0010C9A46F|nr:autotransporter domain-containing protein [Rhodoligotrophos defluvii]
MTIDDAVTGTAGGAGGSGGWAYGPGTTGGAGGGGGAGGHGLLVTGAGTIRNNSTITGGSGGPGGYGRSGESQADGGRGGDGGAGLAVTVPAAVINNEDGGIITGGDGGQGGFTFSNNGRNGDGGDGGAGIDGDGAAITNLGTIQGGTGGYSGEQTPGTAHGGAGGDAIAGNDLTISNAGKLTGGEGGMGLAASGTGGQGGSGVNSSNVTLGNTGTIQGGTGGQASATEVVAGDGGAGIHGSGGTITNSGTIEGGDGGIGTGFLSSRGGHGGAGVNGSGLTVINTGTIQGGNGGEATGPNSAYGGNGGAGITGADLVIKNGGTIVGGTGAAGPTANGSDGNAITFTGGTNVLELWHGSNIVGDVAAYSTADTLRLGGATDSTFDLSEIGPDQKYQGFGVYEKTGSSTWTLTDTSAVVTPWTVQEGTLSVEGTLNGTVDVESGGALGGTGTVLGSASIASGGTLVGQAGQTLTFGSDLTLDSGANIDVSLGAPNATELFHVDGDLTLDGTLNVADAGGFGPGVYRIFHYDGALTDEGLEIGSTPFGVNADELSVQTAVVGQVNLVSEAGQSLNFWDGGDPSKHGNGKIDGGDGIWSTVAPNWTDQNGITDGPMRPQPGFAIFQGAPGLVTVDDGAGDVAVTGMQFAVDGYEIQGDPITLAQAGTIIRVGDGSAAGAGFTAVIGAELTGAGGLNKTDLGTLVLTAANSYTGGTTISGGILSVIGSLGGTVTVNAGGTLSGTGTVGTTTVEKDATIAPGTAGTSIATLHVSGDITFKDGSIYAVDIDPDGNSDEIQATGIAAIEGGVVSVSKAPGTYLPGSHYTIVSATGGVAGTFDTLEEDMPFVDLTLSYDPNNVYLDIVRSQIAFCDVSETYNQCSAGHGAESLGSGNALYDAIVSLPTEADAVHAFDMISGEMHASMQGMLINDARFVQEAALGQLRGDLLGALDTRQLAGGPALGANGTGITPAADLFIPAPQPLPSARLWTYGFGSWAKRDGNGNAASLKREIAGVFGGFDMGFAEAFRAGVMGGYSRSAYKVNARASSADSDNYHVAVYGGWQWSGLGLRVGGAYSWHDFETDRSATFLGFSEDLEADYWAQTAQAFGEIGYQVAFGTIGFEPFAGASYVNLHRDRFTEDGGVAALRAESEEQEATYTTVGLRGAARFDLASLPAAVHGMVAWRHLFGDKQPTATFNFAGGSPFTIQGVPLARDVLAVDGGIAVAISPQGSFGVSYSGQFGKNTTDHGVHGNITWWF